MSGFVLVAIAAGAVVAIATSGSKPTSNDHRPLRPALASDKCPLTDLRARGGHPPARPALAIKIGNEQSARPQSGLNEADIVYDTPAEGFVMRYMAVYQCQEASVIGPTRSVRWVDYHIMEAFGRPILAYAGGINPNLSAIARLGWLTGENLLIGAASAGQRISSRVPPDNLYTSTNALWALDPSNRTPPPPVFEYGSAAPSSASPAASIAINFSPGTDVLWKWDPTSHLWLHSYGGQPDIDVLTGQQVSTTNIVVQVVSYKYGPYVESPGGTGDVESQTVGSGPGYVLRDGTAIKVTWHRASLSAMTTFTDSAGAAVKLAPGRTWVELLLNTTAAAKGSLTITP